MVTKSYHFSCSCLIAYWQQLVNLATAGQSACMSILASASAEAKEVGV